MTDEREVSLSATGQAPKEAVDRILGTATDAVGILDEILKTSEEQLIPWEEVTLPSGGAYYDGKIPGGLVRIRAMDAYADKIMATQRLAQTGQSLDYLYRHCIQLPGDFDPVDLLIGDRTFLLYYLRGITHGNMYEFALKCSSCDHSFITKYDLNELASTIQAPDPKLGLEPFKIVLPHMSKKLGKEVWVGIRFMRGSDISSIIKRQKFKKKLNPVNAKNRKQNESQTVTRQIVDIDDTISESLHLIIDNFMGLVDRQKIRLLADKLQSTDIAVIREFLSKHSPGVDTNIEVSCPECEAVFKVDLPITESFFRPTNGGGTGS